MTELPGATMPDHDLIDLIDHLDRALRLARADERERIAQAIEAQHRRWLEDPSYRSGLFVQAAARIARNGGRDE